MRALGFFRSSRSEQDMAIKRVSELDIAGRRNALVEILPMLH